MGAAKDSFAGKPSHIAAENCALLVSDFRSRPLQHSSKLNSRTGSWTLSLLRSLSPPQKRCDHAWTAPTVKHRDHDERLFLWYVGNQVIPHSLKSKRSGGEIGAVMALAGKGCECADCFVNLLHTRSAASRLSAATYSQISSRSLVFVCLRVENKIAHERPVRRSSLLRRRWQNPPRRQWASRDRSGCRRSAHRASPAPGLAPGDMPPSRPRPGRQARDRFSRRAPEGATPSLASSGLPCLPV